MAAVDHLIAALVELEHESIEIEHRQSFIRSAIEAFGIDADDALLTAMQAGDEPDDEHALWNVDHVTWRFMGLEPTPEVVAPETVQQNDPDQYGRLPGGRWDWDVVAAEIGVADDNCTRRARHLADTFDVSAATAQWMVKRCREMSLIDVERAPVNHQAARDAAAAAL